MEQEKTIDFPPTEGQKTPPQLPPELVAALEEAHAEVQGACETIVNAMLKAAAALNVPEAVQHAGMAHRKGVDHLEIATSLWFHKALSYEMPAMWAAKEMKNG